MDDLSREHVGELLQASFESRMTRRGLLKGAVAAGAAVVALERFGLTAGAQTSPSPDSPTQILSIAATAERLAVTFYTNGMNNAAQLGLSGENLAIIQAALIEEQIHELFFEKNGGTALTSTFSFPDGASTFTNLGNFIKAQQQLEGAFDSAFIAAAYEFSQMGSPALCRIACQIAMVESEHRALGRKIGNLVPADNWTFAPQLVPTVGAAVDVLKGAGYLSPVSGNSYTYQQVDFNTGSLAAVAAQIQYKDGPFVATS